MIQQDLNRAMGGIRMKLSDRSRTWWGPACGKGGAQGPRWEAHFQK